MPLPANNGQTPVFPLLRTFAFLLAGAVLSGLASGEESGLFFQSQILPILKNRCYECHSHEHKIDGGVALDSKAGWENAEVIVPGNLHKSSFIRVIRSSDPDKQMPPKQRLSSVEIAMLETWILMGAPDPRPPSSWSKKSR